MKTSFLSTTVTKLFLAVAAMTAVFAFAPSAQPAKAAEVASNGGYLTVMWGRSNYAATTAPNCQDTPGARNLRENAADLKTYGLWGVGGVILNRTSQSTHQCINNNVLQASWTDMDILRNTYGWKFISQSKTYRNMAEIPQSELYAETGGTLATLKSHGHMKAWGAYNYPNGKQDLEAQRMAMRYFAFGREYVKFADGLDGVNWNGQTAGSSTVFPYPMHTLSVNGGKCNNPSLPCYNLTVTGGDGEILNMRTMSPTYLAGKMMAKPGQWNVIQFYRIVQGKNIVPGKTAASWDCTPSNPKDRWTGLSEMYCRSNLIDALNIYAANASKPRVVAPSDMAVIWNRFPAACTTPPECK
ncbi:MAG: hypothetical protein WBO35_05620 [Candidatus Saccharimonadales bacterium]